MGALHPSRNNHEMAFTPATENPYIEAVLTDWRRKASDFIIILSAVGYLPGVLLDIAGLGAHLTRPMQALLIVYYMSTLAAAVFRQIDYHIRIGTLLGLGYGLAIFGSIAYNNGPLVRAFPIFLAIMLLVINGERGGKIGTVFGVVVVLFAPLVGRVPGMVQAFTSEVYTPLPLGKVLSQGSALAVMLLTIMVVIMRYHRFLIQILVAEHQATIGLEHEMGERRRLERDIARVGDEERRNLGQDLHDGVCQQLTGALLRCQSLQRRLERGGALSAEDLAILYSLLDEGIDEAHAVSEGLCPLAPDPEALAPALRALAKRTQVTTEVKCNFISTGDVSVYDPTTAQHLYRIAQEALSNAARHAQAGRIALEFTGSAEELLLQVEDDGVGMPATLPAGGMGLRTMAYRAQFIDGHLTVEPAPEGGTRIICRAQRSLVSEM